ncbi:unnamed protein product [Amaranthus hypochondriacus]
MEAMQLKESNTYKYIDKFVHIMELPHDLIIYEIVIRLPIKTILQFKSISKQWYSSLSSSSFGMAHYKLSPNLHSCSSIHCIFIHSKDENFLYSFDECDSCYEKRLFKLDIDCIGSSKDEIFLVGSCNGLICLYSLLGYLIIWNPIIHQWEKVSYPSLQGFQSLTWGFGYVASNDDYKIVRICELEGNKGMLVHVFSLKTQKWKKVVDEKIHGYSLNQTPSLSGLIINSTLYWIMHKRGQGNKQGILAFDLVDERFYEIRGLISSDSYLSSFRFLGCIGGCLAIGRVTSSGDVSISIVKRNGEIEYIGLYRDMNLSSCSNVIGNTKDGKFFIQVGDSEIGYIDPNYSPKAYIQLVTFKDDESIRILSYTPSLISPNNLLS